MRLASRRLACSRSPRSPFCRRVAGRAGARSRARWCRTKAQAAPPSALDRSTQRATLLTVVAIVAPGRRQAQTPPAAPAASASPTTTLVIADREPRGRGRDASRPYARRASPRRRPRRLRPSPAPPGRLRSSARSCSSLGPRAQRLVQRLLQRRAARGSQPQPRRRSGRDRQPISCRPPRRRASSSLPLGGAAHGRDHAAPGGVQPGIGGLERTADECGRSPASSAPRSRTGRTPCAAPDPAGPAPAPAAAAPGDPIAAAPASAEASVSGGSA